MTKDCFISNINKFINGQLTSMANNNRAIGFFKPLLQQLLNKNISKIDKYVDMLANKEGEIDIANTLDQMINNVISMEPFTIEVPLLNKVELGGGFIKFQLPMINKSVSFNADDLEEFRRTLLQE